MDSAKNEMQAMTADQQDEQVPFDEPDTSNTMAKGSGAGDNTNAGNANAAAAVGLRVVAMIPYPKAAENQQDTTHPHPHQTSSIPTEVDVDDVVMSPGGTVHVTNLAAGEIKPDPPGEKPDFYVPQQPTDSFEDEQEQQQQQQSKDANKMQQESKTLPMPVPIVMDHENDNHQNNDNNRHPEEQPPPPPPPPTHPKFNPLNPIHYWMGFTRAIQHVIQTVVVQMALHAARNPCLYAVALPLLSMTLVGVGFLTNFRLELDIEAVLSPTGSQPAYHKEWIESPEGFPDAVREVALLMHRDGDNILTINSMEKVFEAVETVRTTEGYEDVCQLGAYIDFEGEPTCRFLAATGYFENHDIESMYATVGTDQELRQALSSTRFANGSPVYHDAILGNWEMDATGNLTNAQSFLVVFFLPDIDESDALEERIFPRLNELRREWDLNKDQSNNATYIQMDMLSIHATQMEYQRAIEGDLYLVVVVAIMMCSFVAITFASYGYGHGQNQSRTLLGSSSVYTITMSWLAGCGVMFICGVPFTPITQMLPFVVFGIGLDDTFIITGAYLRFDPKMDVLERIRKTMEEVAHSISLTTITTVFAFLLGLRSSLPGVQWMCLYAFATVGIDFLYQVTLFVAFIALDERRIQEHRKDVCVWIIEKPREERIHEQQLQQQQQQQQLVVHDSTEQAKIRDQEKLDDTLIVANDTTMDMDDAQAAPPQITLTASSTQGSSNANTKQQQGGGGEVVETTSLESSTGNGTPLHLQQDELRTQESIPERIMGWYADILLRPISKAIVLLLFMGFTGLCAWSVTLLEQEFKVGDFVPTDSYLKDTIYSFTEYASVVRPIAVYFRHVDQGDPEIQAQMIQYVKDLEALPEISSIEVNTSTQFGGQQIKPFCWVRDFAQLEEELRNSPEFSFLVTSTMNLTFVEKMNLIMANPTVREVYAQDIRRDETGNVTASRCWLFLSSTAIDLDSVEDQIDLLHSQREVGAAQPINQGKAKGQWPFFFYDVSLFYWEAYDIAIQELYSTIVSGVVALTLISFVLIPHWSAVLFVTPMIVVLYCNFLGTLQFFGLHINGITYFCVLVSIGLLVDFLLHVLMRYYDTLPNKSMTRDERVKVTLVTMGSSIMLGGLTTFLGVVPLCISTTKIFLIVFKAFFAMVVLGLLHGLVLLPVLLSLVGPNPQRFLSL